MCVRTSFPSAHRVVRCFPQLTDSERRLTAERAARTTRFHSALGFGITSNHISLVDPSIGCIYCPLGQSDGMRL
ncbi:hypothetical protein QQF64_002047 [Cirrhinus molitorella]|uniref:Uncharacterized protein n=1 Tax=Cirrhinus molitorella TaxID=172907 RepID=A0ABR3MP14_9TELE